MKNNSILLTLPCFLVLWLAFQVPGHAQRDRRKLQAEPKQIDLRLREAESLFTEGMKYFILEDYTKALGSFQRAADLNPSQSMVYYKMAEIFAKSSNPEDLNRAAINIEKAIKFEKKNKYFYILAADIYTGQNSFSKAELALETLTKELNDAGEHLYKLAAIYQFDRKPEEAIRTYDRAESQMGINEISSLQKQKIYMDQGKINEALAEGEKLLTAFPDEERFVMGFAQTLAEKGQQKKAIEAVEKFLSAHPESGASRILLAGFYHDTGQETEARIILRQAMADPSVDISSKIIVFETYVAQIRQNGAKHVSDSDLNSFTLDLFAALRVNYSDDPNVHLAGGNLFLSLDQRKEAEQEYLAAIQRGSASFDAWENLLTLESESNKFDSVIFHSEQGLEIFPNQAMLYYFNGFAHIRKGHFVQAASSLEMAKRLSSSNQALLHDILGMLGEAYQGTKEYAKSDMAYDAALAINPDDDFILNNYSYYLALRKEHLEKAEHMAVKITRDHPTNSSYLDTYAWVLFAREKFKEARKVMERAILLPGVSATHYEHYGDILFRLEDVDEAVKQWEKARSLSSQHELIDKKIANRRLY